jgi:hypothetical protein
MESLEPLPETQAALDELVDLEPPSVATILHVLEQHAHQLVPELVGLSVGLLHHGLTFTLVASDSVAAALDAVQYLEGGPCVDLKSVMDRMGHAQIQTTQKYLHTLPDTDQRNLDALTRIQGRA